jgi:hypothetical protein
LKAEVESHWVNTQVSLSWNCMVKTRYVCKLFSKSSRSLSGVQEQRGKFHHQAHRVSMSNETKGQSQAELVMKQKER